MSAVAATPIAPSIATADVIAMDGADMAVVPADSIHSDGVIAQDTNVIDVEFRPVVVNYADASTPQGEIAQRLAAEAAEQMAKLATKTDKKTGTLRALATTSSEVANLNPYLLKIKEGWNSRIATDPDNLAHVDMLARSIAQIGVQQPLTVTIEGDNTYVTDGHCRLLATFRAIEVYGAEIKSVPVRAEGRFATEADRVLSQIVRNSGKALTVLEQGAVFVRLIQFGWAEKDIADKVGLGVQRVRDILALMENSSTGIKTLVAAGKVSATTATAALRDAGGDVQVAEATLTGAIEIARLHGKGRATMKHVKEAEAEAAEDKAADEKTSRGQSAAGGERKVSRLVQLRAIFDANTTQIEPSDSRRRMVISITSTHWKQIKDLLGLVD